jgi:hypothetical protein
MDQINYNIKPTGQLSVFNIKPNYNISFHNNGKEVGKLDFNGPALVFTGDAEESAKVFIDWVAKSFHGRLEEERKAAQRPFVGLTDDEMLAVVHYSQLDNARAIEAKLKEKNT